MKEDSPMIAVSVVHTALPTNSPSQRNTRKEVKSITEPVSGFYEGKRLPKVEKN